MKKIREKKGNITAVVIITAIMVSVIVFMGIEFSKTTKSAIMSDVGQANSGFNYQVDNISKDKVSDAAK